LNPDHGGEVSFQHAFALLNPLQRRQADPSSAGELTLAPAEQCPCSTNLSRKTHRFAVFLSRLRFVCKNARQTAQEVNSLYYGELRRDGRKSSLQSQYRRLKTIKRHASDQQALDFKAACWPPISAALKMHGAGDRYEPPAQEASRR
jgi:hypothetical protein